ncbi:D-2-hydroxyacid dehydrogenase [Lunatibacter salilacus]|uniref:D-2-hydroxyacid dehydrogenase n=1 Tax=Lunatibacter salilacus TaxID=2483804 RepID=UPI00131EA025|nr:D-2-hydroxyacid dehydrogenase [Lunatibacter salilacus]
MANSSFSRRNFLTALASTAAAVTLPNKASAFVPGGSTRENDLKKRNPHAGPIKILCTQKFSSQEVQRIRAAGKNIHLIMIEDASELKLHVTNAEVILGSIDGSLVPAAKGLKWVQTMGAGVENMSKELKEHPCTLTNMQRVYAPVIAETAIALLLSLTRGLAQVSIPALAQRKWVQAPSDTPLVDLYGKTIGIVGMGGIGSETARRLHYGFNMQVFGTDAKPLPKSEFVAELHDPGWFMEMVPQVDVLMSAAPLTSETKGMFNAAVFSKMKHSAYFINVSRGGLVDQGALVTALKEKRIQGAGLDVTTPEPLPADDPLWNCPNLVITPHNSGQAPVRQERAVALIAENVRRYSNNLPLMNVVDKIKGY